MKFQLFFLIGLVVLTAAQKPDDKESQESRLKRDVVSWYARSGSPYPAVPPVAPVPPVPYAVDPYVAARWPYYAAPARSPYAAYAPYAPYPIIY